MHFLWDTNILLHYIRQSDKYHLWNSEYEFFDTKNKVSLSIVSIGEIYSLAFQLNWQHKKLLSIQHLLSTLTPLPIAQKNVVNAYPVIDAHSQGKYISKPLPQGMTSRNMGKNDLWIAATAYVTQARLITIDKDFDHLKGLFIQLIRL